MEQEIPGRTSRREIRAFTSARGLAALYVVFYHFFQTSKFPARFISFVTNGYLAVDFFFILSGYIIYTGYAHMFLDGVSKHDYMIFIGRRLARTYPLYILVTVIAVMLILMHVSSRESTTLFEVICNITMLQGWGLSESLGIPTWSLSTELAAYLTFPAFCYFILPLGHSKSASILVFIGIITVYYIGGLDVHVVKEITRERSIFRNGPLDVFAKGTAYPLMRCLSEFIMGCAAVNLSIRLENIRTKPLRVVRWLLSISIVILLFQKGYDVIVVSLMFFWVLFYGVRRDMRSVFLDAPLIWYVGTISYSIYLVHRIVEDVAIKSRSAFYLGSVADEIDIKFKVLLVPAVLLVAAAAYHYVESPARHRLKKIGACLARLWPIWRAARRGGVTKRA